uniref:Uncharacterized protein n=1 Tax=Anguilla anguilla TaxID=7936 RepID=A0A0E9QG20_ANGAN
MTLQHRMSLSQPLQQVKTPPNQLRVTLAQQHAPMLPLLVQKP